MQTVVEAHAKQRYGTNLQRVHNKACEHAHVGGCQHHAVAVKSPVPVVGLIKLPVVVGVAAAGRFGLAAGRFADVADVADVAVKAEVRVQTPLLILSISRAGLKDGSRGAQEAVEEAVSHGVREASVV